MRGGWHLVVLAIGSSAAVAGTISGTFAVADTLAVQAPFLGTDVETFAIVDTIRGERYRQPVGCWEPVDGGWHLSISWRAGMPCKSDSKELSHAAAEIPDLECTAELCVLPRPGTTFRTTVAIEVKREPHNRMIGVQASINVLRHEPPFLFLSIETPDREHEVSATGVIRVKLYKRLADKVDPTSWRPD